MEKHEIVLCIKPGRAEKQNRTKASDKAVADIFLEIQHSHSLVLRRLLKRPFLRQAVRALYEEVMIKFLSMIVAMVTGSTMDDSLEGKLQP